MKKWFFPTRGFGEIEGFSNPGLEMFKGEPIRAMAREVCQNSLDAKKSNDAPLRVEFERLFVKISDFPGIVEMKQTLLKCQEFWSTQGDEKTKQFVKNALSTISGDKFFILRISDYNTTGLKGAFSEENITPWKGLVQGNAFSIKSNDTAAGSFGIGKATPFVVSKLQTVFYRTFDETGVKAAQGVTHLVSFKDSDVKPGEDPIRRSTGYYGDGEQNNALPFIAQLDALNKRTEHGTDLFIPGFNFVTGKANDWKDEIIVEILDNFLYSICSGKMEVKIDDTLINRRTITGHINRLLPKTKHAKSFYEAITSEDCVCEDYPFHGMGTLSLRVLYSHDANKKVLVVRNSGMKITDIPSLPKGISFVGFLELQGEKLNQFFRGMENPQHNKWEPKRHQNSELARRYKDEVEEWVRNFIGEKIKEISGEEIDIDVSNYFFSAERDQQQAEEEKVENIVDTVKEIEITQDAPKSKDFKVKDIGGTSGTPSKNRMRSGHIDDIGSSIGHRRRTGSSPGGQPTGRKGGGAEDGEDKIYDQMHEVDVSARIIKKSNGINKLIFTAEEHINQGEMEIVTVGENGKPLQLLVKSVNGINVNASVEDGHIVICDVNEGTKYTVEFEIHGNQSYAMGVRAYGN